MKKTRLIIATILFPILLLLVVLAGVNSEPKSFVNLVQIAYPWDTSNKITVVIKPGTKAIADKTYNIDVLHNNTRRATASVSWTETELQREQKKEFSFATNSEEIRLFRPPSFNLKNIDKYFTVVTYTETSLETIEYLPVSPSSFNWWFVLIPLVGIVLLVVYLRILVSYIKEVIATRKEAELAAKEQAKKEAEEAEKAKLAEEQAKKNEEEEKEMKRKVSELLQP